ncbi:hypothetical protein [Desulfosarcina variabilis]
MPNNTKVSISYLEETIEAVSSVLKMSYSWQFENAQVSGIFLSYSEE